MNSTDAAAPVAAPQSFDAALATWLDIAQGIVDANHQQHGFSGKPGQVSVDPGGKKFLRIVKTDGSSRSAYAFIDVATGDVLKPDGWKRPAKGARGNIYTGDAGVSAYGALYAR
jgi:hypothetical protein